MSIKHNSVEPLSKKASYGENENIDFTLDFENEKYVSNSLRISGEVKFETTTGNRVADGDDVKFDGKSGAHSLFRQFTVEFERKGVINTFQNYGRLVRMKADCTKYYKDFFSSEAVCELRAPKDRFTQWITRGVGNEGVGGNTPNNFVNPSFYLKPLICLNEMSGNLSYGKSGQIKVSLETESFINTLYGADVAGTSNYKLYNLRLHYLTVPEDGIDEKVAMRTHHHVKQNLDSSHGVISTRVPAIADSVSCSFLKSKHQNNSGYNNVETEKIPELEEVQFLFNDQITYIDFPIQNPVEVLDNYVNSMTKGNPGHNSSMPTDIDRDSGFGIGLYWGKFVDFTNNKYTMSIKSGISNVDNYEVFMYFHGLVAL